MNFNDWGNLLPNVDTGTNLLTSNFGDDPKLLQLETAKRALQLYQSMDSETQDVLVQICLATSSNDNGKLQTILQNPENWKYINMKDNSGISPLIYSICFSSEDNSSIVETILSKCSTTINEYDDLIGYTPLMWAVYLGRKDLITELLNHGADLNKKNLKETTVFDLIRENTDIYDYFEEHGLFKQHEENIDPFYQNDFSIKDEELLNNIKLQTAGLNITEEEEEEEENGFYKSNIISTPSFSQEEFNFNKLLKNQYIIFSDYDIPSIIDLLFHLNVQYNHQTTYPAAILYQCVRYADHIKQNKDLVENFLNLAFTKIRSTYHNGNIVSQSYWVSVLNFLYYYLLRDANFFQRYPTVLQDLSITLNSLIIELTNSMKFRLIDLIDDCLLNYTNIPEISSTLYKNDWNFFQKTKKKTNKHDSTGNSFDEIYQILYPPSLKDQAKPSPIKIVQTLGALLYVLDLHQVHNMITQETLAIVFHWLSSILFNKIINSKKLLTRSKAIQIRLNLSILEDWARSNNRTPPNSSDSSLLKSYPLLSNGIMRFKGNKLDPLDVSFYKRPLFHILESHFQPVWQLLQWVQCFTMINDEEGINNLIDSLTKLNERQLLQIIDKYRYSIEETKFSKKLYKLIQIKSKQFDQNRKNLFYLKNEELIQLNGDYQFPLILPLLDEFIEQYGSIGLGERAISFQPFLPINILDSIDEIHEQKPNEEEEEEFDKKDIDDGIFQKITVPESLIRRGQLNNLNDDENTANPWY